MKFLKRGSNRQKLCDEDVTSLTLKKKITKWLHLVNKNDVKKYIKFTKSR